MNHSSLQVLVALGALASGCGGATSEDGLEPLELGKAKQALGSSEPVTDIHSLWELRQMTPTGNYRLANDIDAINSHTFGAFQPIGTGAAPFRGTLDGDGHTISNLKIQSGGASTGLIGRATGALIEDLHLTNLEVVGESRTGGLVGVMSSSEIHRCSVEGHATVVSTGAYIGVGLMVGMAYGSSVISQSWTRGTVDGNVVIGGGVVGGAYGYYSAGEPERPLLTELFADVSVNLQTANSSARAGGIAGEAEGVDLYYLLSAGSVQGPGYSGGIVGEIWIDSWVPSGVMREVLSRASVEGGEPNRAGAVGHHNNTFQWCEALWDSTADPGTPTSGDSSACQQGIDNNTLELPRENPNDPLYFPFIHGGNIPPGQPGFPNGTDGSWDLAKWDLGHRLNHTILQNIPAAVQPR